MAFAGASGPNRILKNMGEGYKRVPPDIKPATRRWLNYLQAEYELESHHFRFLLAAARAWDRAEDIREILAREGYQVVDRFSQSKAHPLLAEERGQMKLFSQMVRECGFDLADVEPPRRPRIGGKK